MRSFIVPGVARPAISPFTSAMNTGTPIREKPSASIISETDLAGSGRARDQSVTVAVLSKQVNGRVAFADQDVCHSRLRENDRF